MAFVDDDEEEDIVPQSVTNYYFEDDDKSPVSFACLPIQWRGNKKFDESSFVLYLRGTSDVGNLLHKHVKAWKFDLNKFTPEISVLTKDNIWIKLEKPRKSFEELIRSVLVTLHSLQYLRRKPQSSDKSLWDYLTRKLRSYDVKPSQNDLVDHIDLITEAAKRDVNLLKSKFILGFLAKKPTKKKLPDKDNTKDDFIVEDDDTSLATDDDELDDEDDDFFESVCAICDNGGKLLCCEGSCLRSFHATKKDGEDLQCDSLGFNKMQVEAMPKYLCPNCEHKIHQCFICKNLGSSDNSTGTAEVFQCVSATCGYFYHPRCVTRRLRSGNEAEYEAQIIAGEYTCPLHRCRVCGKGEDKTEYNLQFAVCRRCPKSYHRKCLPQEISFEDTENEDIIARAWDGLLNNRVLIYCLDHEIDEELETPVRDHVKFPVTEEEKSTMEEKRRIPKSILRKDKVKDPALHDTSGKASVKSFRSPVHSSKDGLSTKNHGLVSSVPDNSITRKRKEIDPSKQYRMAPEKSQKVTEFEKSCGTGKNKMEVKEALEAAKKKLRWGVKEAHKAGKSKSSLGGRFFDQDDSKHNETNSFDFHEPGSEAPTLDNDSKRRLLAIMEKTTEEITMDTMLKKYRVNLTHINSTSNVVDKTITIGKVEGSVQAARTALKKLEEGGNIEDAKAVCEPKILNQIFKWKVL